MSLPKYIVNMEELGELLKDGVNLRADVTTGKTGDLLRDYLDKLLELLKQLLTGESGYTQRSVGLHGYIPALAFDYELVHTFDDDVYITGITYSQTGWKVMDCWSLYVGDRLLFDGLFTKELGEYKHFNALYGVSAGTEIKVVHHNNSGNSKQVWFDIDYLKKAAKKVPGAPELPAGCAWIIVISWENGGDIDCCWADAASGEVLMGYSTDRLGENGNRIFKDRDNMNVNGSEMWSIEGPYRSRLKWGFGWYDSRGPDDVKIRITLYDGSGNIVDEVTDITGSMLGTVDDRNGDFLFVYEFDMANSVQSEQWTRIS